MLSSGTNRLAPRSRSFLIELLTKPMMRCCAAGWYDTFSVSPGFHIVRVARGSSTVPYRLSAPFDAEKPSSLETRLMLRKAAKNQSRSRMMRPPS